MAVMQRLQGGEVHVVVMVVAEKHRIDGRQVLQGDAGRPHPARTHPRKRAGAIGKERVGEDVEAARLDEAGGLADEGDAQGAAVDAPWRGGVRGILDTGRLWRPLAAELPLQQLAIVPGAAMAGHEKALAIEMVAGRAGMIAIGATGHGADIGRIAGDSNRRQGAMGSL